MIDVKDFVVKYKKPILAILGGAVVIGGGVAGLPEETQAKIIDALVKIVEIFG